MKRILCIAGPTGAGKTAAALRLGPRFQSGIINCDSRQLYRAFPVITAQPSPQERSLCPHVLYGFLETEKRMSAGEWSSLASDFLPRFTLPILVGGTGLYLRALFDGIVSIPRVPEELTQRLMAEYLAGNSRELYARLEEADPAYASRIHPNDRQRVVRALAVLESTGHTFSWWHEQTPPPPACDILRIGLKLPLKDLEPLLYRRIELMLDAGAIEEVKKEWERLPDADAPGWSGIGCHELLMYLQGTCSLDEACSLWRKNTRAYAKRQLTWFNADPRIHWFHPDELDRLEACVNNWWEQTASRTE